jgi:RNA polymerase sigma-70 factor (ECF subfamily)
LLDGRATWDAARGAKFTTWFYTVVTNLALSRMRKGRMPTTETLPEPEDAGEGPEGQLMAQERQDAVRAALSELTGQQRLALELFYYSGLSQQDAAKAMNVNLKAYESLLSRAKKQLKEELVLYA